MSMLLGSRMNQPTSGGKNFFGSQSESHGARTSTRRSRPRECRLQVVVTPLGPSIPVQGYHSSLLIDSAEYCFDSSGILKSEGPISHSPFRSDGRQSTFIDLGVQTLDVHAFETVMSRHFSPGTYDLLRKNCNSFSDCAIFFLTGMRLNECYREAERIFLVADRCTRVLQLFLGYKPNPFADGFDLSHACHALGVERQAYHRSGATDLYAF